MDDIKNLNDLENRNDINNLNYAENHSSLNYRDSDSINRDYEIDEENISNSDRDEINIILSWLCYSEIHDIKLLKMLLKYFHNLKNLWDNFEVEYPNLMFLKDSTKKRMIMKKKNFEPKFELLKKRYEFEMINIYDANYPERLKYITNPPYILFCRGNIDLLNKKSIAIVGSRKATAYGKYCANKFAFELANFDISIISGMARGIDGIAHRASLDNGGTSIGVIASGLNIEYPTSNKKLYERMNSGRGLIITEFFFSVEPLKYNFPLRNRIISGISDGILVIEAAKKSGTMITAGYAGEQGKTVFAVPGNIDSLFSTGTNALIKDGAKITTCTEDILEELNCENWLRIDHENILEKKEYNYISQNMNLNEVQKKIVNNLETGSKTTEQLSEILNCDINDLLCNITLLELQNAIYQENNYLHLK